MGSRQLSDLRKLQRNQLLKINKEELIDTIISSTDETDALDKITKRLDEVMEEMKMLKNMITSPDSQINKKYTELKSQIDKQAEILTKQQQFLEILDRKEREPNIVILGVPDNNEALDGVVTDEEKIAKIWSKVGMVGVVGTHRRLGGSERRSGAGAQAPKRRPILFTLDNKHQRSDILQNAPHLKNAGDNYNKIYIKKDTHPSVRAEWRRLREAETREKARPENVGCTIRLDTRERKLYKDTVVIDSWNPQFF